MNRPIYQDKVLFPKLLWTRPVQLYLPEAGKILILAGSKGMTGIAILACEAVFRSGTGILLLGFPESLKKIYKNILPPAMALELPETKNQTLSKKAEKLVISNAENCNAIIIGPGLSRNAETMELVWKLISKIDNPIILDDAGIHALENGIKAILLSKDEAYLTQYFANKKGSLIITATLSEIRNIANALNLDRKYTNLYIKEHLEEIIRIIAKKLSCIIVAKGVNTTILTNTGDIIINRLDGLKTATDDINSVLSSVIGSFIAQNPGNIDEAITVATYIYDLSKKLALSNINKKKPITVSDIIHYIPKSIKMSEAE